MNDDYLWNRSGDPDHEIAHLEEILGTLRHEGECPAIPSRPRGARVRRLLLAVAAILVVFLSVASIVHRARWRAQVTEGVAIVDGQLTNRMLDLQAGSEIETGEDSSVRLRIGAIGEVIVAEQTRITIEQTTLRQSRLALNHGRISARISSPPRLFFVRTPMGEAIDLGCAFTLEVDPATARGRLSVSQGWVALGKGTSSVYIPAGASSTVLGDSNFAPPVFDDATPAFRQAIRGFVLSKPDHRASELAELAREARSRDTLTLWHLLLRTSAGERAVILRAIDSRIETNGIDTHLIESGDEREIRRLGRRLGIRESRWWLSWAKQGIVNLLDMK